MACVQVCSHLPYPPMPVHAASHPPRAVATPHLGCDAGFTPAQVQSLQLRKLYTAAKAGWVLWVVNTRSFPAFDPRCR